MKNNTAVANGSQGPSASALWAEFVRAGAGIAILPLTAYRLGVTHDAELSAAVDLVPIVSRRVVVAVKSCGGNLQTSTTEAIFMPDPHAVSELWR
jgi:DNA-binding transcriptional LysR family regulator